MATFLDGFAILLFFALIIWVALGRSSRRRERQADRRRMGGRPPRSSWITPSRDQPAYTPGLLLLTVALWQIAGVIATNGDAGDYLFSLVVLSGIVAVGFSIRADIVGAGMGFVGVVSQNLDRLQANGCPVYTLADNRMYWILAGTVLAVLVGLRLVVTPVHAAGKFLTGPVSFLWSRGRPSELGVVASTLLTSAGALDLVDLATKPDVLAGLRTYALGLPLIGAIAAAALLLFLGVATLPRFTMSVLGLGVVMANVIVAATSTSACEPWVARIAIAISLLVVNRFASRFI